MGIGSSTKTENSINLEIGSADNLPSFSSQPCPYDEKKIKDADRQLRIFQILYDLALSIPKGRSIDENLDLIAQKARQILQTDTSFIALVDDQCRDLYMRAFSGIHTADFRIMRFPLGSGMGGKVSAEKLGVIVYDYFKEMAGSPVLETVRAEGLISGIAVPLRSRGVDLGVLYVFNRSYTKFTEDDLATVTLIGNLAAVEISRSIYAERLRQAQGTLEARVLERTASLMETKKSLEREIADRKTLEEALIQSERRYRGLVEGANDIIFSCDVNGCFTLINQVALRITGYSREEILGRRYVDFIHPIYKDEIEEFYFNQLTKRISDTYKEYPIVSKNGQVIWLGQIVQLITEQSRIMGFQAIARDITKRKAALKALEESEQEFRSIFEYSPIGIFRFDRNGVITTCNEKFIEIIGSSREKLVGLDMLNLLKDGGMLDSIRQALSGSIGYYEGAYASVTAEKITPVKCVLSPVLIDGVFHGGIGIVEDITERRKSENELRKSKEMMEAILNASSDTAFLVDTEGRILRANKTMAASFNVQVDDLIGKNCFDVIDAKSAQRRRAKFGEVISEKKAIRFEDTRAGKYFDQSFYPIFDSSDEVVQIAVFSRDITEQKKSQEAFLQSERFKAVAGLAAGVAHNFNNLLQVVMAGSELALQETRKGNLQNIEVVMRRIINGCKFGAETVKRLQEFAGTSSQRDRPVEILDVSEIIKQAVEITKPFWKNNPERDGIYINMLLNLKNGCFLAGKKHEMFEVLVNLIKNSVEAMPDGGDLHIACERQHREIMVKIKDTGIGICSENMGKLFTPFFTTKMNSGAGLGLATTRKIINDHGGHIFAASDVGKGALFTMVLPLKQPLDFIDVKN